jgi:hypothetical protein
MELLKKKGEGRREKGEEEFGRIAAGRRPGFAGFRYRSIPAYGGNASRPSNPLRGLPFWLFLRDLRK